MAIDSKELRIGNWIMNDAGYEWQIEYWYQIDKSNDDELYNPIPLSTEVLEACGFVNVREVHWCVPNNDPSKSFDICVWSDHVSYTLPNFFHLKIKSLHQLQNLYFSQTETELTYNPSKQ